jgi:hypothetical protein
MWEKPSLKETVSLPIVQSPTPLPPKSWVVSTAEEGEGKLQGVIWSGVVKWAKQDKQRCLDPLPHSGEMMFSWKRSLELFCGGQPYRMYSISFILNLTHTTERVLDSPIHVLWDSPHPALCGSWTPWA